MYLSQKEHKQKRNEQASRKEVRNMARPITPTPRLDEKHSESFCHRVQEDLKKPAGPIATPRLDGAIKMIMADARQAKK